jgi:hypothetical protein
MARVNPAVIRGDANCAKKPGTNNGWNQAHVSGLTHSFRNKITQTYLITPEYKSKAVIFAVFGTYNRGRCSPQASRALS